MTIEERVRQGLADVEIAVLAVSGGADSMVLLDAAASVMAPGRIVVATFDHGTGAHASRAVKLVARRASELGLPAVVGRGGAAEGAAEGVPRTQGRSEATLRAPRWAFLASVAQATGGTVVTAHTRDDQVETVLMRIMRGAGARGIAGLYADSPVRRPLLDESRAEVRAQAASRRLAWEDDPSNRSRRYFRNRIRLDLLPALRRVHPELEEDLLALARRAATWRSEVDIAVERHVDYRARSGALDVAIASLAGYSRESLAVLWAALAARIGIALDHRGTRRLVAFTTAGRVGSRIQLSGGWEVARGRHHMEVRRQREREAEPGPAELSGTTYWGRWVFEPLGAGAAGSERDGGPGCGGDAWSAQLPAEETAVVRRWRAGDSMTFRTGEPARKVKRFLADAGITGRRRWEWPVVLAGEEVVWIPGVCRSDAATGRSGTPARPYRCELDDIHDR